MKNPEITIVIATYNSEKTLGRALTSVKNQTYQNWECLIIDGASNDNTINIVKEYQQRDKRFRYISEPDKGIYDAFNKGWKYAKADWVLYLGSDDKLLPNGIEALAAVDKNEIKLAIVCGVTILLRTDGSQRLWYPRTGIYGCHQAMITRKCLLEKYGGYDLSYRMLSEHEFHVRLLNKGYIAKGIQDIIACFTVGGTTSDFKLMKRYFIERYRINKKWQDVKYPLLAALYTVCKKVTSIILHNIISKIKKLTI